MFYHFDIYKLAAQKMIDDNFLILDTETTGLSNDDEIIELGITDCQGNVLYEGMFHPEKDIHWAAAKASGITKIMLADKPSFKHEFDKIMGILNGRPVIAFNEPFDERMFYQTAHRYGLSTSLVDRAFSHAYCCQYLYGQYIGFDGPSKLETACANEGIDMVQTHRAAGDCLMTLALLERVAEQGREPNLFRYKALRAGINIKSDETVQPTPTPEVPPVDARSQSNIRRISNPDLPSYLSLFQEHRSIAEIAQIRGVKTSTVENNLVNLYLKGEIESIDFMIDDKYIPDILEASQNPGWDGRLKSIKEQLPEECSYGCIRAVLAKQEKDPDFFNSGRREENKKKPLVAVIEAAGAKAARQSRTSNDTKEQNR